MASEREAQEQFLREQIIGEVFSGITQQRLREVTRLIIEPLVRAADVAATHKDRALSPQPAGMHPDTMEQDRQDITEALANMVVEGTLTLTPAGAYELTTDQPEPDTAEAIKYATDILSGWPDAARRRILNVLAGKDSGEDE